MNAENTEQPLWVDLSAYGSAVAPGAEIQSIRTSGSIADGEHWAALPSLYAAKGGFSAALAPYSVTTFLIPASLRK